MAVDKSGVRAATGSFCSSGIISTGNNSTPAPEEVVTGRRRAPFVQPEPEPFDQEVIIDIVFLVNTGNRGAYDVFSVRLSIDLTLWPVMLQPPCHE